MAVWVMVSLVEREQGPVVGGGVRGGGSVRAEVDVVRRGFGGLFSKPGSSAAGAVLAALVVVSSVLVLRSEARSEVLPDLSDGHAWLRSTAVGVLSLVDGASGDVVGSFNVAKAADDFEIQSEGSDAIVVNRSDHTIRRMLARTWEITKRSGFEENVLDVLVGEERSWMIKPGSVSSLDLDTSEVGESLAVGADYDDGHVSREGALFYGSSEADEAPLVVTMVDGEARAEPIDGLAGPVEFAELEDTTVVVDHGGLVWIESGGIVCDDLQITDNGVVAAGGFDRLLVVTSNGVAFFWDPRKEGCPSESLALGASSYGHPVVGDGWAVVPDLTTGELVVIFPDGETTRKRPEWVPPGAKIELTVENDKIWFNDPNSAAAGVVRRDGTFEETTKYTPGGEGVITPKVAEDVDDTSGQGNQVQADEGSDSEALTEDDPAVDDDGDEPSPDDDSAAATTTTATSATDGEQATPPTSPPAVDGSGGPTTTPAAPPTESAPRVQIAQSNQTPKVGEKVRYQAQVAGVAVRGEWRVRPDDGKPASEEDDFSYTFGEEGRHTVEVRVCVSENRCADASIAVDVVGATEQVPLVAEFVYSPNPQQDAAVVFRSAAQGEPDGLRWTFEGGSPATATGTRADVIWPEPGTYAVTLEVVRGDETHSETKDILVSATAPATTTTAPTVTAVPSATTAVPPTVTRGAPTATTTTSPSTTTTVPSTTTTASNPHSVVRGAVHLETNDFTIDVTTNGCSVVNWRIVGPSVDTFYPGTLCESDHGLSPRTTLTLAADTSYTVTATFTFQDEYLSPVETWQVRTTTPTPQDPIVNITFSPSGADLVVTVTTDKCTVMNRNWFSTIDGDPVVSGEISTTANGPCGTVHTGRFTRVSDGLGGYRAYRVNATVTDDDGINKTVNRDYPGG